MGEESRGDGEGSGAIVEIDALGLDGRAEGVEGASITDGRGGGDGGTLGRVGGVGRVPAVAELLEHVVQDRAAMDPLDVVLHPRTTCVSDLLQRRPARRQRPYGLHTVLMRLR